MNTQAQIAKHLNVVESAIIEVQEWARVLWVRVRGIGARFVSKKAIKVGQITEAFKQVQKSSEINLFALDTFPLDETGRMPYKKWVELRSLIDGNQTILNDAWKALKEKGYERFEERGNAAFESGHSDYHDEDANYNFFGVKAPDGTYFRADKFSAYWYDVIPMAAKYAGI